MPNATIPPSANQLHPRTSRCSVATPAGTAPAEATPQATGVYLRPGLEAASTGASLIPVDTARRLVEFPVADFVPTSMLEAVGETLAAESRRALQEVQVRKGSRGNATKRARAEEDADQARWARGTARSRRSTLLEGPPELPAEATQSDVAFVRGSTRRWERLYEVEGMPPLGPRQWAVVAQYAPGWRGTVSELVMVVRELVPDEQPLDVAAHQASARRERVAATASAYQRALHLEDGQLANIEDLLEEEVVLEDALSIATTGFHV